MREEIEEKDEGLGTSTSLKSFILARKESLWGKKSGRVRTVRWQIIKDRYIKVFFESPKMGMHLAQVVLFIL